VSKPFACLNDEPSEDDKDGDNKVEECDWALGELVGPRVPRKGYLELGSAFDF
jgi:hypothetical protein